VDLPWADRPGVDVEESAEALAAPNSIMTAAALSTSAKAATLIRRTIASSYCLKDPE
jgi:hypothetical protein